MTPFKEHCFNIYSDCFFEVQLAIVSLEIIIGKDNPLLRKKSAPVPLITKDVKKFIEAMHVAVQKAKGVGLAAPQVGRHERIVIAKIAKRFLTMINPKILEFSEKTTTEEEGCLSLPDLWGPVERPEGITIRFTNEKNEEHTLYLSGLDSRVVQHEVDHLDGILFIDRMRTKAKAVKSA
jgi:peptide deformylase